MNEIPLMTRINEESEDKFVSYRLQYIKFFSQDNTCEILFHYAPDPGASTDTHKDIEPFALKVLPPGADYRFRYARMDADADEVKSFATKYLEQNFKIAADPHKMRWTQEEPNPPVLTVTLGTLDFHSAQDLKIASRLAEALDDYFCQPAAVRLASEDDGESLDTRDILDSLNRDIAEHGNADADGITRMRVIRPINIERVVGDLVTEAARYIKDAKVDEGKCVFCGIVTNLEMRAVPKKTDPDKIFNILNFRLSDFTGSIRCCYFVSAANMKKIDVLEDGCTVSVRCEVTEGYNKSGPELKLSAISTCVIPEGQQEVKYKRPAPSKYTLLTPTPYVHLKQADMFSAGEKKADKYFEGKTFVVFDTETTGLSRVNDRIIEIALVKIVDGKIESTMSTFVNPGKHIPDEASKINHIDDAMVREAPRWEDIVGDIYKFCSGATLVAHNAQFDIDMVNNTAESTHFYFENSVLDTIALASKKAPGVRNFKLATLLDYFGLVNEDAHRALTDTLATAQLFLKLMQM